MSHISKFDVLLVYCEKLAMSAANSSAKFKKPFVIKSRVLYNEVYGYFLDVCRRAGVKAAFTTSADIIGPGKCSSYWIFRNSVWKKMNQICTAPLIFDNFSPTSQAIKQRRDLLFASPAVVPFNQPELFETFFDKQKTYVKLAEHAIPTITLTKRSLSGISKACVDLAKLTLKQPDAADFGSDVIMKDRFGAGGQLVYKFKLHQEEKMLAVMLKHPSDSFIIQPFALFDRGFSYQGLLASTDIRVIYLNNEIIQFYIRVAKTGEFRCNEHQGGLLTYLTVKEIPLVLQEKASQIMEILGRTDSLFSLDFVIANSGNAYLLEGNTGPGLDWNTAIKKNELQAKNLIRLIVKRLAQLAGKLKPKVVRVPVLIPAVQFPVNPINAVIAT